MICQIFGWDFDSLSAEIQSNLQDCIAAFEDNGDVAVMSKDPKRAITHYSAALSLNPLKPLDLLVKRSTARGILGLWEDALKDADEVPLNSLLCRAILNLTNAGRQVESYESMRVRAKIYSPTRFERLPWGGGRIHPHVLSSRNIF